MDWECSSKRLAYPGYTHHIAQDEMGCTKGDGATTIVSTDETIPSIHQGSAIDRYPEATMIMTGLNQSLLVKSHACHVTNESSTVGIPPPRPPKHT